MAYKGPTTDAIVIDRLWQGESGNAPWQRRRGQIERGQNIRFDLSEAGAVKRNGTKIIADLESSPGTLLDPETELLFIPLRDAIFALGDGVVYGWRDDGSPITITDDSGGSFAAYLAGVDPDADLDTASSFDTIIVSNRNTDPVVLKSWSFRQCYNYILSGDPTPTVALYDGGYTGNKNDDSERKDLFVDFEEMRQYFNENPGTLKSGYVVRLQFDNQLNPEGFYIYVPDDEATFGGIPAGDQIFIDYQDFYRVPNGRGPSLTGDATDSNMLPDPNDPGEMVSDTDAGQGAARPDGATLPHRIVYNENTNEAFLSQCPWRQRVSGSNGTNRAMPWFNDRYTIQSVTFASQRLFFFSQEHITSSRANDFFNLWVNNINAVTDSDRISDALTQTDLGSILRSALVGSEILVICENGQVSYGSGEARITNVNGNQSTLTTFQATDLIPAIGANETYIIDEFGDVHQYRWLGIEAGMVYSSMLTVHKRDALYGKVQRQPFIIDRTLFITNEDADALCHDMFLVEGQLVQSAWGTMDSYDSPVFFNAWAGHIRVIEKGKDSYSLLHYVHRDVEPALGMQFTPFMDRLEQVNPLAMTYDPATNETTMTHEGRSADSTSMVVTLQHEFIPVKRIGDSGEAIFDGDLTSEVQWLGFTFRTEMELSKIYPAITSFDFVVKKVTVFHQNTTDYTTSWVKRDKTIQYDRWQGHRVGRTVIGESPIETHYREVHLDGAEPRTEITLFSDSPGPVLWSALEIEVLMTGPGSSA